MMHVDAQLHIYGDGNIFRRIKELINQTAQQDKIFLKGKILPGELHQTAQCAYIGINLVEPFGLNQLYSLANKFFDYIQAGIPQVTMNFPEYKKINELYEVAVLLETVEINEITGKLNILLTDPVLYKRLKLNCLHARGFLNWGEEERKLINFYDNLFST
jgi:glycosyltransferase involved in cell wall biosynthesis